MTANLWTRKLAAWLHDPAEKALVLMRDVDNIGRRIGHEHGSVAALRELLGISDDDFDRRADRYAAAADRPQWPFEDGRPRPSWANVRFVDRPVLIHSLSGEEISLGKIDEVRAAHIRNASLSHFADLIERNRDGTPDHRLTQLAFWRFGPEPELVAPELGELWRLLPADTRVPDHSIWQHLDVVSALAAAMADGDTPALLSMSFGPVQGFISQARSMSDLWAGSHLLSSLVWEGMEVICDRLGPDSVLFPNLRGVAVADRWLLRLAPQWRQRFEQVRAPWLERATDANPLFSATLPNKFMALVPARQVPELADAVTRAVRGKAVQWALDAAHRVFAEAQRDCSAQAHWRAQVREQMQGFPEVHWGSTEWPTASEDIAGNAEPLRKGLAAFGAVGLFGEAVWEVLAGDEIVLDGASFFEPNAGILYPAVHDLAERTLAAAKALRPFEPLAQGGYRCTLTAEHEWLTDRPTHLMLPPRARAGESAWSQVAGRFGIKDGEHLGAVATLKRLWPTMISERFADELGVERIDRFVVSTHTMAITTSLARLAEQFDIEVQTRLEPLKGELENQERTALPASLDATLRRLDASSAALLRKIPSLLDQARDAGDDTLERRVAELFGDRRPETYYALIQMDGDRMGAWMAGNEPEFQRRFADTWHPQVRASAAAKFGHLPAMRRYFESPRPASPARHVLTSAVLNDFSTHVARHVVEQVFKGKLIYSGGDDLLAMVSVDDLLPCMLLLRACYSGVGDGSDGLPGFDDLKRMQLGRGYVRLGDRLLQMMGTQATASIGAIVAHHQAPLSAVLRELRAAEQQAKRHLDGSRNAFCVRVMKRGGGEVAVTSRFWKRPEQPPALQDSALGLMLRLVQTMGEGGMSRRAVYRATEWLAGLPPRESRSDVSWREMVTTSLGQQLERQGGLRADAAAIVDLVCAESAPADTPRLLADLLVCAEFFAREGRTFASEA
jgi:CRISPR-associated protein Cmr2